MSVPAVTEDEIANAAGMGDVHDGVNFMRAACVIAMEKAKASFEPMLEALRHRSVHIMRRLFPIVEHMVRKGGSNLPLDSYNKPCQEMIRHIYEKFVDRYVDDCLSKCRDDLKGMTRFVTWDVDGKGGSSALYKSLPTPGKMVEIYSMAVDTRTIKTSTKQDENKNKKDKQKRDKNSAADRVLNEWSSATGEPIDTTVSSSAQAQNSALTVSQKDFDNDAQLTDYHDLLQLTEEMLSGRNANRTSTVRMTPHPVLYIAPCLYYVLKYIHLDMMITRNFSDTNHFFSFDWNNMLFDRMFTICTYPLTDNHHHHQRIPTMIRSSPR